MPTPMPPRNVENDVVVESKLPTVNCDVVAISVVPAESETMMEFGANDVALVPPLDTATVERVRAPDESDRPVPSKLLKDEPLRIRLVVDAVTKEE